MTALPPPADEQAAADELDKTGVEYNIIMELVNYRTLATMAYNAYHGQEVGEDPEYDKLEKRERKAYKALLDKIAAYSRTQTEAVLSRLRLRRQILSDGDLSLTAIPLAAIDAEIARLRGEA